MGKGWVGIGAPKASYTIHWNRKAAIVVLIEGQKGAQCTCQAETVVGSSLTPSVALLVCPGYHTPHS